MADYPNMGPMMTDAEEAPAEESAPAPDTAAETEPTAELPKSVLGGKTFKPGEEVVLKVVAVRENSVLVAYATDEEEPTDTETPTEPTAAAAPPEDASAVTY